MKAIKYPLIIPYYKLRKHSNKKNEMERIKPTITAKGFRTAVQDYGEDSVIEELAANSYDEEASTVLVLLDNSNTLYIMDDGTGFNKQSIEEVTTLGGGDKSQPYAKSGTRVYLGSYGYGLKSTLNIANKLEINSASKEGVYHAIIDWTILEEAFKPGFEGYHCSEKSKENDTGTGSIIKLQLKNPTTKSHLDSFGIGLSNLPNDRGKFKCYYGFYDDVINELNPFIQTYKNLESMAASLYSKDKLKLASDSFDKELQECDIELMQDKDDKTVSAKFYFAGMQGDKVGSLKESLRGIYVRVHDRLLKHNFSEDKYVYGISKYPMFKQGLRVELSIDWLRNQITLSRDGIKFSNDKLEKDFKSLVGRVIGKFIRPKLDKIKTKRDKLGDAKLKQRIELANQRIANNQKVIVKGITGGFTFKPETDAELAILLAQSDTMAKIEKNYKLIDYNDKTSFDCIIYDSAKRNFIYTELEPTLMEFLEHKNKNGIQLVIIWSLGKWRMGAKKKGKGGFFELIANTNGKKGHYKLLEYPKETSAKPRLNYQVIVIEEIL